MLHDFGIQIVSLHVDYKRLSLLNMPVAKKIVCSESGIIHLRNESAHAHNSCDSPSLLMGSPLPHLERC